MTQRTNPAEATALARSREDDFTATRTLLVCGIVAGPLFVAILLLQLLIRDGFDLTRHPISLLSLGNMGWVQITNFIVSGLLCIAFAVGVRRFLRPGRGGTWGPVLLAAYGAGLVAGGVFVTDPGLGFPPGTPEGVPDSFSWHATVHGIAPAVAFNALVIACFVFVRRFLGRRERGWAAYSAATGLVALGLTAWPSQDGISVRLAIAVTIAFAWLTLVARKLLAELTERDRLAAALPRP